MKYRCLVFDHDDTVVASSPCVHYPAFLDAVRELRPGIPDVTLEGFYALSCFPGFFEYYRDVLKLSPEELEREEAVWRSHVRRTVPKAVEGMGALLRDFKARGGILCVASHSAAETIRRDYLENFGFLPDRINGLEDGWEKMKPNPWPLLDISEGFGLSMSDMAVVDDLRPGLEMAKKCGVDFIAAGWSHAVPELVAFMKAHAAFYAATVGDLRDFLGL